MSNELNTKSIPNTQDTKPSKPLSYYFMVVIMVSGLVATVFFSIAHIGATYPDFPWGNMVVVFVAVSFLAIFWLCAFNGGYKKGVNSIKKYTDKE